MFSISRFHKILRHFVPQDDRVKCFRIRLVAEAAGDVAQALALRPAQQQLLPAEGLTHMLGADLQQPVSPRVPPQAVLRHAVIEGVVHVAVLVQVFRRDPEALLLRRLQLFDGPGQADLLAGLHRVDVHAQLLVVDHGAALPIHHRPDGAGGQQRLARFVPQDVEAGHHAVAGFARPGLGQDRLARPGPAADLYAVFDDHPHEAALFQIRPRELQGDALLSRDVLQELEKRLGAEALGPDAVLSPIDFHVHPSFT